MGDEPTNMVKLAGKTGYINIVTGEVLIKPIFDELIITGKNTNAQGVGLAVAQKSEKWGVLATNGKIIVPFDYNFIGELSTSEGKAIAVKSNQLLQLNFNNNQFINATEVSTVYSSNFVPRLTQKTVAKPYDGFYVAKDYPNMKAAFDGWQTGKLSWVAQPSFQVKNDEVFVSFGIFRHVNLPLLSNVMSLNRQVDGFTLVDNFDSKFTNNEKTNEKNSKNNNNKTNNILSFSVIRDGLKCNECEKLGLPVFWQLTQPKPAQTFGGIGVAISKMFADSDIVDVKDVIIDGPAYIAGLRANDSIVAIDGVSVAANSIDQVREKLRGSEDSAVKVKYIRGGRAYVVNITRKVIKQN